MLRDLLRIADIRVDLGEVLSQSKIRQLCRAATGEIDPDLTFFPVYRGYRTPLPVQ
jgi:hypothetical protein